MGVYFDDVVLTIQAEGEVDPALDFSCDARGAVLNPETTVTTRNYLCGPMTTVGTPAWTAVIDFDQNWDAATGLSQYLFDHAGEKAEVIIQSSTLAKQATFTATLVPGAFGGTAGEVAEASVELGVDDQPVFAPYTPVVVVELAA